MTPKTLAKQSKGGNRFLWILTPVCAGATVEPEAVGAVAVREAGICATQQVTALEEEEQGD
jgi:hypothetical protein